MPSLAAWVQGTNPVQQPLDAIGSRVSGLLRRRPAVLPLQRRDQPPHVGKRRPTRLLPAEPMHEPLVHHIQLTRPRPAIGKVPTHDHTDDRTGRQSR